MSKIWLYNYPMFVGKVMLNPIDDPIFQWINPTFVD